MIRLRRYSSRIHADHAVAYLRQHGVAARVVGEHVQDMFAIPTFRHLQLEVVLLDASRVEEARRLLDEFDAAHADRLAQARDALETDDDDADATAELTPDLSRLAPEHAVAACPACSERLPLDARLTRCPRCSRPVDVVEVLIERFGPEALAPCYDAVEDIPDPAARARAHPCRACGYDLRGLPVRSRCPECGTLYDKSEG